VKFFDDFLVMTDQLQAGARLLEQMLATDPPALEKASEIKEVEHKCDFLTHEIVQRLNRTFVTPLDREDIHTLAISLDDIMDAIDAAAALFETYKIQTIRPGAREITRLLTNATGEVRNAIKALERKTDAVAHAIRINDLEHEADQIHQQAIGDLFDQEKDPIMILKWKEIFDVLEEATDCCEDVANVVENIVVKHG
jgi:predicted phosphate transport protein (TIGR00153 family)